MHIKEEESAQLTEGSDQIRANTEKTQEERRGEERAGGEEGREEEEKKKRQALAKTLYWRCKAQHEKYASRTTCLQQVGSN